MRESVAFQAIWLGWSNYCSYALASENNSFSNSIQQIYLKTDNIAYGETSPGRVLGSSLEEFC